MEKKFYRTREAAEAAANKYATENNAYVASKEVVEDDRSLSEAEWFDFAPDFSFSGEVSAFEIIDNTSYEVVAHFAYWEACWEEEPTYMITKTKDGYDWANGVKGMREVLAEGLSLEDAQARILDELNAIADEELGEYFGTWEDAVEGCGKCTFCAAAEASDGTRHFRYDVWTYRIEPAE